MDNTLPPGFKEEDQIVFGITDGGLFHLKLNRPEKKNACSYEMYDTTKRCMDFARNSPDVKVVIMYGANGSFCAGNDFMSMMSSDPPTIDDTLLMFESWLEYPKPIVYFIQGCCVGLPATLSSFVDFIYCSDDAFFLTPFMTLNLC